MQLFKLINLDARDSPYKLYDVYDAMVVCAEDMIQALSIRPSDYGTVDDTWPSDTTRIELHYIGQAAEHLQEPQIIFKSFQAG